MRICCAAALGAAVLCLCAGCMAAQDVSTGPSSSAPAVVSNASGGTESGWVIDSPPVIQDFTLSPAGHLLLLELSRGVYEYDPAGQQTAASFFDFAAQGLTASRLACDPVGNFYFVDGRNCLIAKAENGRLTHLSHLGPAAVAAEPGVYTDLAAPAENVLQVTAYAIEQGGYQTYTLDVSGEQAVCTGQTPGVPLDERLTCQSQAVTGPEGGLTGAITLTLYAGGTEYDRFTLHATGGCTLYGVQALTTDSAGRYILLAMEFLPDGSTIRQSLVQLDRHTGSLRTSPSPLADSDTLRRIHGQLYILRTGEQQQIFPLPLSGLDWQDTGRFTVTD